MKIKVYKNIGCRNIWIEGKTWRLSLPNKRTTYFHFQKFDKDGKNGERTCYNIGIFKKNWGRYFKWTFDNITFYQKFRSDNDSPQCG